MMMQMNVTLAVPALKATTVGVLMYRYPYGKLVARGARGQYLGLEKDGNVDRYHPVDVPDSGSAGHPPVHHRR